MLQRVSQCNSTFWILPISLPWITPQNVITGTTNLQIHPGFILMYNLIIEVLCNY